MKQLAELMLKNAIDKINFYGKLIIDNEVLKAMVPGRKIFRVFLFSNEWDQRAKRLSRNKVNCFLGVFCLYDHLFLVK